MQAYIAQRQKDEARRYRPRVPQAYPLEEARKRLRGKLGELDRWTALSAVAPMGVASEPGPSRASYVASTLSAGLEMVREGELEARQVEHFADIYLRARGLRLEAAE
jgi:segregation and condensation protein A